LKHSCSNTSLTSLKAWIFTASTWTDQSVIAARYWHCVTKKAELDISTNQASRWFAVSQWDRCLYVSVECAEAWCVPCAIHARCIRGSQNEVCCLRVLLYFIVFLINMESRAVRCNEQETCFGDKVLPRKHERNRLLGGH
jgi:hypothetical protein